MRKTILVNEDAHQIRTAILKDNLLTELAIERKEKRAISGNIYKGKVKDIMKDKIILVEFSRDFRGKLKPRELILEFHKGEVE